MKYFFSLFLTMLIAGAIFAQKNSPDEFAKQIITPSELKKHLTIVASAEMEGRNTPSPGLEKAADYITSQFKSFGLQPGNKDTYRQTFQLAKDSVELISLTINGNSFKVYEDFAPMLPPQDNLDLNVSEYTFVGYGIQDSAHDDYAGLDLKDKVVILLNGAPSGYDEKVLRDRNSPVFFYNRLQTVMDKGAKAIFVITDRIASNYRRRSAYRPKWSSEKTVPVFSIGENILRQTIQIGIEDLKNALNTGQAAPQVNSGAIHLQYKKNEEIATASNVLGVIEGTDKKDEYLFITAHYDHLGKRDDGTIYYGADDDGSGTVSVITMAKAFAAAKKAGKGPRRTIVFMTVSGEEKGLWGSEYYSEHPVYPLEKTTADLNIDMIGRVSRQYLNTPDSANYVHTVGNDKLSTDLTAITNEVNDKYTQLKLDQKYNDPNDTERIYYRSDHFNFARKGVPIIFYFDGMTDGDYHQPTDTVDKINFSLLARRAQLVFHTAWEMANRDDMLKRDLKLPDQE